MNPETLLAEVSHKMFVAAQGQTGMIRIIWHDGEFQCWTKSIFEKPGVTIAKYQACTIIDGLTSNEWSNLSTLLQAFLRLKKL